MLEVMSTAFRALAPIYILLLIGYFCRRTGLVRGEDQPRMNSFGFTVFLPLNIFYNIYTSDFDFSVGGKTVLFVLLALVAVYFLNVLTIPHLPLARNRVGVVIQAITRGNAAILGVPIIAILYPEAKALMSLVVAVAVPIYNISSIVTLEIFNGRKPKIGEILLKIATNPLIIGSVLGIVFKLLSIPMSGFLLDTVKTLSGASTPFLVITLGVFMRFKMRVDRTILLPLLGRLVLMPLLVLSAAYLLGFKGASFACILVLFITPTAVASFATVQKLGGDAELAGNTVILSSVLAFFTMLLWIALSMGLGII